MNERAQDVRKTKNLQASENNNGIMASFYIHEMYFSVLWGLFDLVRSLTIYN